MIPRRLHQFYAFVAGYFWRPCPLCGEDFGGHEWKDDERHSLALGNGRAIGLCPRCPRESVDGAAIVPYVADGDLGLTLSEWREWFDSRASA